MEVRAFLNKYFDDLSELQIMQFQKLHDNFLEENSKINLVSRKDINHLFVRHILHSLAFTAFVEFAPATKVADVGTGGGFPGLPLAIFFPEVKFTLIDSKKKKIDAVQRLVKAIELNNVRTLSIRTPELKEKFDFVIGRAVTAYNKFYSETIHILRRGLKSSLPNGILYLKGGDFKEELQKVPRQSDVFDLRDVFEEDFFETKKIIYTPL